MSRVINNGSSQGMARLSAVVTALPFTFACWYKPIDGTVASLVDIEGSGNGHRQRIIYVLPNPVIETYDGTTSAAVAATTGSGAGAWLHCCGVFSSTTSRSIFANGGGKATNTGNVTTSGLDTTYVGTASFIGQYANGSMAEVAIWNVALTDAEVFALGNSICPLLVRPASLVSYWPLYGIDSPERDVMVAANHLTLFSGPPQGLHVPYIVKGFGNRMLSKHSSLLVDKMSWHPSFPDQLMDSPFESVASGFSNPAPRNPINVTPT